MARFAHQWLTRVPNARSYRWRSEVLPTLRREKVPSEQRRAEQAKQGSDFKIGICAQASDRQHSRGVPSISQYYDLDEGRLLRGGRGGHGGIVQHGLSKRRNPAPKTRLTRGLGARDVHSAYVAPAPVPLYSACPSLLHPSIRFLSLQI